MYEAPVHSNNHMFTCSALNNEKEYIRAIKKILEVVVERRGVTPILGSEERDKHGSLYRSYGSLLVTAEECMKMSAFLPRYIS